MALERRNPLPLGLYWVDVFQPDEASFLVWLQGVQTAGAVVVIRSQHFPANDAGPERDWVLFRVKAPVQWAGPGFPTIAETENMTAEDSGTRPDPEHLPSVDEILPNPKTIGQSIVLGAVIIGGFLLLSRKGK